MPVVFANSPLRKRQAWDANILRLCSIRCPNMNQITLEDTLAALKEEKFEVHVPEEIRVKARRSIDRMLEMS